MTKINDSDFPGIAEINATPCYTADRFLSKVDESVIVTQICQDSNVPELVIINFTLVGVFLFTPYCTLLQIDDTVLSVPINVPLAIGHYKNSNIPINTNCQVFNGQLVFNFGSVISNYTATRYIKFELGMIGQVPQAFGVSFPNQTPTYIAEWNKGVLPNPVGINFINGSFNIIFEHNGDRDCSCNIQCIVPESVEQNIQFCKDQRQTVSIYNGDLSADPSSYVIQLSDTLGNKSTLLVQPVLGTIPKTPAVTKLGISPKEVGISIAKLSANGIAYDESVRYQILKYSINSNNISIWKDWNKSDNNTFIDTDVLPGVVYGYALKVKGTFDDESNLSDWATIIF